MRGDIDNNPKIIALRQKYLQRLDDDLKVLFSFVSALQDGDMSPTDRQDLERQAHSMCGAGATFGFPAISKQARILEDLVSGNDTPQPDAEAAAIQGLCRVCQEITRDASLRA